MLRFVSEPSPRILPGSLNRGAGPGDRERVALGVHCSAPSAVGLALSPGLGSAPSAALVRTLITAVPCLPSRTVLSCDGGDLLRWPATPRFLGGLDGGRVFRVEIALSAHIKLMGFTRGTKRAKIEPNLPEGGWGFFRKCCRHYKVCTTILEGTHRPRGSPSNRDETIQCPAPTVFALLPLSPAPPWVAYGKLFSLQNR